MVKPMRYPSLINLLLLSALLLGGCGAPDKPSISLFTAIERGDIDQLERHIYWKTDVNAPLPGGSYPLHETARVGQLVMVKMLLEEGVSLEPRDAAGRTPLEIAMLNGRTQTAETLIKAGAKFDPSSLLLLCAQENVTDRDVVRFLRQRGADIEARDDNGYTPLLIAARHGNHRLIHHLIEYGANVNTRGPNGESALDLVRRQKLPEVERFLLRNGADG